MAAILYAFPSRFFSENRNVLSLAINPVCDTRVTSITTGSSEETLVLLTSTRACKARQKPPGQLVTKYYVYSVLSDGSIWGKPCEFGQGREGHAEEGGKRIAGTS